jgi:hypothetical protein
VRRAVLPTIAATLVAAAVGGCGLGAGSGTSDARLTITQAFGSRPLAQVVQRRVPGAETVMQYLERNARVATKYGGGFVQSIDGLAGSSAQTDWFFYVNGIEATKGAAATAVNRGDQIWWDRHDWSATNTVPAVVGSFPEPFVHGIGGKRLPTVLECASDVGPACQVVARELKSIGIPVAIQLIGGGSGQDSLALVVGTWADLHGVIATELIDAGPKASGVYAQFVGPRGQAIELDDPKGDVVRTLRAGSGLIAATQQTSLNEPVWLVTGTDPAGVNAAAAALTPTTLHDHFALAVVAGRRLPLPIDPGR